MIQNGQESSVTKEDLAGLMMPSKVMNRIFIQQDGPIVRIAAAEVVMGSPIFHTVLTVAPEDAVFFGNLIAQVGQAAIENLSAAASDSVGG